MERLLRLFFAKDAAEDRRLREAGRIAGDPQRPADASRRPSLVNRPASSFPGRGFGSPPGWRSETVSSLLRRREDVDDTASPGSARSNSRCVAATLVDVDDLALRVEDDDQRLDGVQNRRRD